LKVGGNASFERGVGFASLFETLLHLGGDFGVSVGEAVRLVDVVSGVELFVLAVGEDDGAAAVVGLVDVLPLLGADCDDGLVVEEEELVVG
jgi:hypothetical protein